MGGHPLQRERVRDYLIPAPTFKSPEIIYPLDTWCCVKKKRYCNWPRCQVAETEDVFSWSDSDKRRVLQKCFCPPEHAAHISHYINPWCLSVHGKTSVLCIKVTLHFSFTVHSPLLSLSLDLSLPLSL